MPALAANMGYDAVKDFTPIISVAEIPNVIIANVDFPAKKSERADCYR